MLGNTLENKAKFFAQYWGQKLWKEYKNINCHDTVDILEELTNNDYLEIAPLLSITDGHAIELYRQVLYKKTHYESHQLTIDDEINQGKELAFSCLYLKGGYCGFSAGTGLFVSDYLRSKGYALPYLGLSVEKQIEYGWVKLKEMVSYQSHSKGICK